MGARREIKAAVSERYRVAGRAEKGRMLDELCKVTGWHRKHAVRALADRPAAGPDAARQPHFYLRRRRQGCADGVVGGIGPDLRQAAEGDDPDIAAGTGATRPTEARCSRSCAGARDQRSNDRPASCRHQDRGGRRQAPSRRLLLRHSTRSSDPHVQRLGRSAAGLLRDRHGRSRWHQRRGVIYPNVDDGGCRDGLDGVPALGDARG